MSFTVVRSFAATLAVLTAGASGATGTWSAGKLIASDEGESMRYELDLLGGASLYVILADTTLAPRAVHLVTRALPAPQMVSDETGYCAPPAAGGDNGMVGSVALVAQMDEGHRVFDLTRAAQKLYESIAMDAIVGSRAVAAMVDVDGMALGPIGVALDGLEPGARGVHLHRLGSCTPDFKAASGHINPRGMAHGLRHPDGPDIIHAEPDDHLPQPISGAGSRIACGVIGAI